MPKYSILMRLQGPDQTRVRVITPSVDVTLDSLLQQSLPDWELLIAGTPAELASLPAINDSRIYLAEVAPEEELADVTNRLLPTLGTWVGTITSGDRLVPTALAQIDAVLTAAPATQVLFTDEESRNWSGQISMRSRKGALNPLRLRSQEYLRDFALIARTTLAALGGFNPLTTTVPKHDLYLRVLETSGPDVFCAVPERLYQRYRDHRQPLPRVRHDLEAVKQHLARQQIPALVRQLNGQAIVDCQYAEHPWVTALIVVHDDVAAGLRRITRSQVGPVYQPVTFKVLHVGSDAEAGRAYQEACSSYRLKYVRTDLPLIQALNQEALITDTALLLFLQGEAVHPRWLHRLVDHVRLSGSGAVGASCFAHRWFHQPGIPGHRYDGWDWNTGGRFDVLIVPHQTAAVSPACLLIDTRRFLEFQFDPNYPTLYGMELGLRLDQAGFANLQVATSRVEVALTTVPPAETAQLSAAWPGWSDRFGLHLPLQQ